MIMTNAQYLFTDSSGLEHAAIILSLWSLGTEIQTTLGVGSPATCLEHVLSLAHAGLPQKVMQVLTPFFSFSASKVSAFVYAYMVTYFAMPNYICGSPG